MEPAADNASFLQSLPRVVIVSRRTVRKNKFVDFVGEYHLDLIVGYGAAPVIVPRVPGVDSLLDAFEPIHGVLLCEGEDIDPKHYAGDEAATAADSDEEAGLTDEQLAEVRAAHASDAAIDATKDSIEMQLARRCLERSIPFFGICRGSQVLNVACGGTLYTDVETELTAKRGAAVKHIDYDNYDDHRHPVTVLPDTPLYEWFRESLATSGKNELLVNSYHHQGVRSLASRLRPMALSPDGLTEAFFDPDVFDPPAGRFLVGLQFHPERMRRWQDGDLQAAAADSAALARATVAAAAVAAEAGAVSSLSPGEVFDYPECPRPYREFVTAVVAFERRVRPRVPVPLQALPSEARAISLAAAEGAAAEKETAVVSCHVGHSTSVLPAAVATAERPSTHEQERAVLLQSFSFARARYVERQAGDRRNKTERGSSSALEVLQTGSVSLNGRRTAGVKSAHSEEEAKQLEPGAEFLQVLSPISPEQVLWLQQVGATLRNASLVQRALQAEEGGRENGAAKQAGQGLEQAARVSGGEESQGRLSELKNLSKMSVEELQQLFATYRSALVQVHAELLKRGK